MPGWRRSAGSGPLTSMRSNATSTAWINQHQRKGRQGEEDDRSRAVRTGSGQRGAGPKGRREVDAHSRPRTAPPAGKSLAGAHRPGASARVGALRRRWEPGHGWNHGEAHHGGSAHAAGFRNHGDASRRSQGARVQLGRQRHALGARSRRRRHAPDAVAQHRSPLHLDGRRRAGTSASTCWIACSAERPSAASSAPRR